MSPNRKIENIYLWGIKVLLFLIPFLPLYISTSMVFPYVTGKNFAFRILVEVATVLWIGLITVNKKYMPHSSAIVLSILTFTFIVGIADLSGVNPYNSFWSNYERMEGYITILHLAIYFLIIRSVLQTRKDWLLFFNIILAVSFIVSLFALSLPTTTEGTQFWMEYGTRIYGTIGNPTFLAAYMLLTIFIGFITFLNTKKKYLKAYYIILILLNSAVIYLTATRGAILSGFIGLIIICVFYISDIGKKQKWKPVNAVIIVAFIVCLATVATLTIASNKNYSFKRDITLFRFSSMLSDYSVRARLTSWKMAWNGIKEKPFLGWGQENFVGIYMVNLIPFKGQQVWADRAHNIVIEWLINAGILGLSSYISILGSAVYTIRKKYTGKLLSKKEAVTIVTALFVYFLQNLFTFDTINTYFIFFALMAYIDIIGPEKGKASSIQEAAVDTKRTIMKSLVLTLLALLTLSVISYFANYRPIDESRRAYQISKSVSDYKSFPTLLRDFKNALALNTFGDNDVKASMEYIAHFIITAELPYAEGAPEFLKETVVEMESVISNHSYDLEYLTRMITLFNRSAFYEPAYIPMSESLIKACMDINLRYEWLNYALADIYKLKKEYSEMFEIVKNMAALDPHNDQKQLKLALAAIFMKKEDVANNALKEINKIRGATEDDIASGKSFLDASELYLTVQAYQEVKDFQKVINYLTQWSVLTPNRAKIHFDLANAYLNLGDEVNSLKEINKAAEMDPPRYGELAKQYRFIK
jgi:O-antigen ligase/tetratricopeptide (TPR) repeat protein